MSHLTLSRQRHCILVMLLEESGKRIAASRHFAIYGLPGEEGQLPTTGAADPDNLIIVHDFAPPQINNDISRSVADELLPLFIAAERADAGGYSRSEQELFEHFVGAIVRSMDSNDRRAWHRFYDNTLAGLRTPPPMPVVGDNGPIATFRNVYDRIEELAGEVDATSVLDVGTCFGFLPLYLARQSHNGDDVSRRIVGCDLNPALVSLAEDYRQRRMIPGAEFICADILADQVSELAAEGSGYDVVTAIHLIEHLTAAETIRAMENLWALTRRRLIVAVPFESEPDRRYGHRQVFDRQSLLGLGRHVTENCRYFEHHGGWIVLDRQSQQEPQWEGVE